MYTNGNYSTNFNDKGETAQNRVVKGGGIKHKTTRSTLSFPTHTKSQVYFVHGLNYTMFLLLTPSPYPIA